MTEEREKYLAGISNEERVIRQRLSDLKYGIRWDKLGLAEGTEKDWYKYNIANEKVLIKALKKQLPAPKTKLELSTGVVFLATCPICKYPLASYRYCPICGQKLR